MYDELDLDMLGDERTALFLIMSDTDGTFAFLISLIYSILFNRLCELAPEHLMLALMLDQNDLPKILLERVGVDNPEIIDRLNNYVSKRSYFARGKRSEEHTSELQSR